MEKPFGAEDELQVQHVKFLSVGFGDLFQVVPGEKLFAHVPDLGENSTDQEPCRNQRAGRFRDSGSPTAADRIHVLSARR